MSPEPAATPTCKVMKQYRSGGELVYELESGGASLDVRVSSRSAAANARDWNVAAQTGHDQDSIVIAESAPTKSEALEKVGITWADRAPELGLPLFDWDAVTAALRAVRAI